MTNINFHEFMRLVPGTQKVRLKIWYHKPTPHIVEHNVTDNMRNGGCGHVPDLDKLIIVGVSSEKDLLILDLTEPLVIR